eukprot:GHVQ01033232.1.p1 GENE.GHVQ01033232.1~~GHVQ01033232.1.p1  ORF type:complete len:193 (-),score=15.02 GHVQ01033232.1:730-1233(-)
MTELIEQTISCTKEQTANVNTLQSIACRLLQHRFPPVTMSCILQLPVQYSSTLSSVAHSPELAAPGGSGGASEAPRPLSSSAFGGMRSDAACHVDSFNGHNNPARWLFHQLHISYCVYYLKITLMALRLHYIYLCVLCVQSGHVRRPHRKNSTAGIFCSCSCTSEAP